MCLQYELYLAEFPVIENSRVQRGTRPVLVVSNDLANRHSPVIHVIPLTSRLDKNPLPTHVTITGFGLFKPSVLLVEQLQLLDKTNLLSRIGSIEDVRTLYEINKAMGIQFGRVA